MKQVQKCIQLFHRYFYKYLTVRKYRWSVCIEISVEKYVDISGAGANNAVAHRNNWVLRRDFRAEDWQGVQERTLQDRVKPTMP